MLTRTQTSMTTGMTCGRRRVRSSMKRASDLRQWRRIVSKSVAPSPAAFAIESRTTCLASSMQILGLGRVHPAPGDDLRTGDDLAGGGVDGDDHDDDAFFREHPPVAQHAVADVADDAVDVHVAGGHRAAFDLGAVVGERHRVAVLADDDVVVGDADLAREPRVVHEMAVLAVHRNEPLRRAAG